MKEMGLSMALDMQIGLETKINNIQLKVLRFPWVLVGLLGCSKKSPTVIIFQPRLSIMHYRVKSHYEGAKIVVTLYCLSRIPCLNFDQTIIMKDFHNVFAYYGRFKPK
jgi:hypothetical protein